MEQFFAFQARASIINASLSTLFWGLLGCLHVPESETLRITWLTIRITFVFLIALYLYTHMRKIKEPMYVSKQTEILVFSLIIALALTMPDFSYWYYSLFLVPSYILYVYALRLTSFEKSLLAVSFMLFSFPMHAAYVSRVIGGALASAIDIAGLASYGSLLFLSLTLYRLHKAVQTKGIRAVGKGN